MNEDRIHTLLGKQDDEMITESEIEELIGLLREKYIEFDEFTVAKIAFQRGYTNAYHDDTLQCEKAESNEKNKIATSNNWTIDYGVVAEFYSGAEGIIRVFSGSGDLFYFSQQALDNYAKEIEVANSLTVDELLETYCKGLKNKSE